MDPLYFMIGVIAIVWIITILYVRKIKKFNFYKETLEKLSLSFEQEDYKDTDAYKDRIAKIDELGIKDAIVDHMDELDTKIASSFKVDKSIFLSSNVTEARNDHMRRYAIVHGKEEEFNNIEN